MYLNSGDPRSYEHYWTSSWNKAWKKIQARRGFEPMTFAILVQRSINGIAEVMSSNRFFNRSAHIWFSYIYSHYSMYLFSIFI